ncbi:hypothetical protein Purlil1_7100 [Purpureocillium lilacinum]|uniref:UDP-N-acetylglucosamine transferase subunit ALG14 n=1 Tax=Purpureocillium lilacinum TaxID=33203 RepID=A0ABR0BWX6_PURLI|nr:hypothetical protein Purlil1_7100 [Purpureocillium lilacinum]
MDGLNREQESMQWKAEEPAQAKVNRASQNRARSPRCPNTHTNTNTLPFPSASRFPARDLSLNSAHLHLLRLPMSRVRVCIRRVVSSHYYCCCTFLPLLALLLACLVVLDHNQNETSVVITIAFDNRVLVHVLEEMSRERREATRRVVSWAMEVPTREEREDPFAGDGFDARRASAIAAASSADDNTVVDDDDNGQDTTIVSQGPADQGEQAAEEAVDYPADLPPRPPGRLSFVRPDTPQFSGSSRPSTALSVRDFDPRRLLLLGDRDSAAGGRGGNGGKRRQRWLSARFMGLFSRKRKASDADQQSATAAAAGRVVTVHLPDPILLKFLFVGGKGVGQTSLLDTSGTPDLNTVEMVRPHCFDAVFLCFDVQDRLSMRNIVTWWTHARTRAFTKESPFQMGFDPLLHLVGLKKDLRLNMPAGMNEAHFVDTTDVSSFLHLLSLRSAMALQKPSWGGGGDDEDAAATSINAHRYIECSAKTHEAMDALFDDAGREATRRYVARATRAARGVAEEAARVQAQAQAQAQAQGEQREEGESSQKRQSDHVHHHDDSTSSHKRFNVVPQPSFAEHQRPSKMGREALALSGLFAIAAAGAAVLWHLVRAMDRTTLLTATALLILSIIIITTRHAQILRRRRATQWPKPPFQRHDDSTSAAAAANPPGDDDYFLFVLGSGGHTKEMLMMMDDGFCHFAGSHRRYLISSGDHMSAHHLRDYEAQLASLCRARGTTSPGSFDTRTVTRARRVHQPLWSTPATALRSVVDIFPALLAPPEARARHHRLPTRVFSNGPATGFFVALAVHLLKMAGLVPEESMRFVYVESWARISTLSLTGKLLYYTGLADAFYVQHADVAAAYGLVNAGEMVFNARRPDVDGT